MDRLKVDKYLSATNKVTGFQGTTEGGDTFHILAIPSTCADSVSEFLVENEACQDYINAGVEAGLPLERDFNVTIQVVFTSQVVVPCKSASEDDVGSLAADLLLEDPDSYLGHLRISDMDFEGDSVEVVDWWEN